jgi:hypothetical protein
LWATYTRLIFCSFWHVSAFKNLEHSEETLFYEKEHYNVEIKEHYNVEINIYLSGKWISEF